MDKLSKATQDWFSKKWEKLFSKKLSFFVRILLGAVLASTGFGLTSVLFKNTGTYFTFVTIFTVILISLFTDVFQSLFFAVVLSLANDFYNIPPIGSVFDDSKSIEHFVIICSAALFTAIIISSMRLAFQKIATTRQESEQATALMEKTLALVSHDIRNPLAAINLTVKLILRYPDQLEKHIEFANKVLKSLDRIDSMIETLLDVSRLRSGKSLTLNFHNSDLSFQISSMAEEMKLIFSDKLEIKTPGPLWGNWGIEGIRRAVENLVANAIKYGDVNKPISISVIKEENFAVIAVHNWGEEISPKAQEKLFDAFYRPEESEKSPIEGWGLGLTLVKGVAESHGGSVQVKSKKEYGTTFTLKLPIKGKL